ncbi:hypothetical protein NDU88_008355 [Pleurodeles waltl]|uniref:Uncharacterized protein n=1 Tax=Pleurodeles waltl TaxID=8319 RepID=A0AAV7PNX8_PLEWA|nr:hypothetical protein NDU88_008355 [Pleurodeles waltl]
MILECGCVTRVRLASSSPAFRGKNLRHCKRARAEVYCVTWCKVVPRRNGAQLHLVQTPGEEGGGSESVGRAGAKIFGGRETKDAWVSAGSRRSSALSPGNTLPERFLPLTC